MFEDLFFPTSWVSASLMNLSETEDSFVIELRATGLSKEDIDISIEDDVLIVKSKTDSVNKSNKWLRHEFRPDKINKRIEIPYGCDLSNIKAKVELGILTITIPKDYEKTNKKYIMIE